MSKFVSNNQHEAKRRALAEAKRREEALAQQQKKKQVQIATVLIAVAVIALLLGVVIAYASSGSASDAPKMSELDFSQVDMSDVAVSDKPTNYVLMDIRDHGQVVIRLFENVAPKTVENFKDLVAQGFYDGLTFHRILDGFMAQGGDPDGNGSGNGPRNIKGEFNANGFTNNLLHKRGVISMARGAYDMNSASCQFFIMFKDTASLDGNYASFGYVCNGMETIDHLTTVERTLNSSGEKALPVNPVVINSVKFVTVKGSAGNPPAKFPTAWVIFGSIAFLCVAGVVVTFAVTNRKKPTQL